MEKFDLKVALVQVNASMSIDENLKNGLDYCRKAHEMGADIALFPEMYSTGYTFSSDVREVKNAINMESDFIKKFRYIAKELNMAIAITYLEEYSPSPQNVVTVIDRFGNCVLTYAKVHTCTFGNEYYLTAGEDFYVTNLNTVNGEVTIGAMICYDREFPESARILMLRGAEIILVPNACNMEQNRLAQLRTRAFENMVGIATCNYAHGHLDCNGHSSGFDGMMYGKLGSGQTGVRDTMVVQAGGSDTICLASFPISLLREYRKCEIQGNAYRRPEKYGLLLSEKVDAPIRKSNATRFKYK